MMNTIEKIIGSLRTLSLSEREHKNMRLLIEAHVRENPMKMAPGDRMQREFSRFGAILQSVLNSQTFLTHPAVAAFALVLCISIGTSYAAQAALPGQALYSFKTRVNEPVQGLFAFTPQDKALWSAELTNRRLQEAETLAATNRLSPVATADIATGLDAAVENFNSSVALVSRENDVQAANTQSDLEATLNAHEIVLASLPTSQKDNAALISSLVRQHASAIGKDRSTAIAAITATNTPALKSAALTQQKNAQETIKQVKLLTKIAPDMQVASSVIAITQEASSDIEVGDTDAKKGNWGHAFGAFQDAIRKMKETQDGVETRAWLKNHFGIGLDLDSTTTVSTSSASVDSSSGQSDDSSDTDNQQ